MKRPIVILIAVVILAAALGGAYYYYTQMPVPASQPAVPLTKPDPSVVAGPVKEVSASSITIAKQPGATAVTFTVNANTKIVASSPTGGSGSAKPISYLTTGMMVLITPLATDTTIAGTIVAISPPPKP